MPDDELIDLFDLISESTQLVEERFKNINTPEDFILSPIGGTLLDAIVMRLQVIGESVKQIMKSNPSFFQGA
jgi:uncharacterized protein with HEPN domain